MKYLIGLVGANSKASTNRKLLQYMQKHFANQAQIELVEIKDFPLFNKPADKTLPDCVKVVSEKIAASDGVIIATPEYDHAVPASLINALNWLSYGNFPFVDQPVMIVGASYGTLGSSRAQMHLRQILDAPELKARIMPSSEFLLGHSLSAFDEDGNLNNSEMVAKIDGLFADFMIFIQIISQLQNSKELDKKAAAEFSWENI
ncbi:NADPH-dependent FMN reductase [Ligilactobacillus sp. Marseille-Q7487]|jgi:NAD(P)H-dependent FMN reductase|uniref:NADPH-dependent FMN reductase n=1 Tax=Ligilactobacillus sp. Marseille-Q7487 TaxID=3022128 RepID=UPI0024A8AEE5|nr:NADPH-dependent FMN reductase [Ligilactobacillus sp. Marseille-Q7487]